MGHQLQTVAQTWEVPFQFVGMSSALEAVTPAMLGLREGEVVAVNCALRLHQLLDESVSPSNPRNHVLRTIRALNPKICTLVEQHTNHNSPFFLARFYEALYYYFSVFESIDAAIPRDDRARRLFEEQVLGKAIVNLVAAEGQERTERQEPLQQWQQRMRSAGLVPRPISARVVATVKALLRT